MAQTADTVPVDTESSEMLCILQNILIPIKTIRIVTVTAAPFNKCFITSYLLPKAIYLSQDSISEKTRDFFKQS